MRSWRRLRTLGALGLFLAGGALTAVPLKAQDTGTITGRVTQSGTGQPVGSVQVFITELDLGVLSQPDGDFTIQDVPAGTHEVTAQRLGFREAGQQITVAAGETTVQNFELAQEALQLNEVIVTGTPGGTQRRAIGNAVGTVNASELTERAQIGSVQELMQGRSTGLDFNATQGNVGTGSMIRIRGVSSLSLNQQPLIYVDGVRVNNNANAGPFTGGGNAGDGGTVSVLEDFSPSEIESIEVIKGPAAATLYGTEASAGVIQIITKRGQQGAPTFHTSISQGANYLADPSGKLGTQWGLDAEGNLIEGFEGYPNIYEWEKAVNGNDPLQYGRTQSYNLDVRGGTDQLRYYVSGSWQDDEGIVSYNWNERLNLRANLGIVLSENLDLDVSTGFVSGKTSLAQQLSEPGGIWDSMMWAQPELINAGSRGFLRYTPEDLEQVSATREYERFTGSVTATHTFGDWLTQRLVVGIDRANDENQVLVPRQPEGTAGAFGGIGLGEVSLTRPKNKLLTFDYAASVDYRLNDNLSSTTSAGAQYYSSETNEITTKGSVLATEALRSIEGATSGIDVGQFFVQNKSLGFYLQQELNWNDRIFLTAAVRRDDNSAFGADFSGATYPKVSGTWVISEEGFWDVPYVSSLRLRSALGQAGRQPQTFDAVTLYAATTGRGNQPAALPQNLGNPEVGPEIGTELEVGFDYGLLEDRVSGEFTYYHQWTRDALADLALLPSQGFSGTEARNLGQLNNWGWEVTMNASLIQREGWGLDLGLAADHTMNEIIDLGGRLPTNALREGFPFPAETSDVIVSAEFDEFGSPTNVMCDAGRGPNHELGGPTVPCSETEAYELLLGPNFSPYNFSADLTLSLLDRRLQLFAVANGEHGRWLSSISVWCRFAGCFTNTRVSLLQDDPIYVEGQVFQQRHPTDQTLVNEFNASFWKLRQIGARYQIPEDWLARTGVSRASVSISGNNVWTIWQKTEEMLGAPVVDPEFTGFLDAEDSDLGMMPPLASFALRMDVTF